jgi:hypothetical protein
MAFPFADIHREINGLMFEQPGDVAIKVDSLDAFTRALSDKVELVPSNSKVERAEFCGVKITENGFVPPGMAVIMHGSQIVNIIRYVSAGEAA